MQNCAWNFWLAVGPEFWMNLEYTHGLTGSSDGIGLLVQCESLCLTCWSSCWSPFFLKLAAFARYPDMFDKVIACFSLLPFIQAPSFLQPRSKHLLLPDKLRPLRYSLDVPRLGPDYNLASAMRPRTCGVTIRRWAQAERCRYRSCLKVCLCSHLCGFKTQCPRP